MKPLKILLALVFCSQTVLAGNEPQKSDMEMIIRAMAEQYIKSAAQDIALKELQKQAAKVVGEQIAAQVADTTLGVLSAVSFVQNVQAYDAASTEGGKYSAAAHAVAAAIAYAFSAVPLVGLAVNLGVAGQDLMAVYISKDFILEQAKMRAEISRIYKETSDIQLAQYNAEVKAMGILEARFYAVNTLALAYSKAHEGKCDKDEFDYKTPTACFYSLWNLREAIEKQIQTIGLILNFKGRFLKPNSNEEGFKKIQDGFKAAEEQYSKISKSMNSVVKQVVFEQVWDIRKQHDEEFIFRRCETSLLVSLKKLLNAKKELLMSQEQDAWLQSSVMEKQSELRDLVSGICSDYLRVATPELRDITMNALQK